MLYIIPGDLRALLVLGLYRYILVYTRTDIGLKDSRRTPRRGKKRARGGGNREEEDRRRREEGRRGPEEEGREKKRTEGGGKREAQYGRLEWEV